MAGVNKARGGVEEFVAGTFKAMTPSWLPEAVAKPYGYALPYAEIVVGAMLIFGVFGRLAGWLTFLMLASFTTALMVKLGLAGGSKGPFHSNIILATLALLLAMAGPGRYSLDAMLRASKASRRNKSDQPEV